MSFFERPSARRISLVHCTHLTLSLLPTLNVPFQEARGLLLSMLELSSHRRPTAIALLASPCLHPYKDKRVDSNGLIKPLVEEHNDATGPSAASAVDDPWRVSRRNSAASRRGSQLPDGSPASPGSRRASQGAPSPANASPSGRRRSSLGLGPSPWGRAHQPRLSQQDEQPSSTQAQQHQDKLPPLSPRSAARRMSNAPPGTPSASGRSPSQPRRSSEGGAHSAGGKPVYEPSQGHPVRRDSRSLDPWRKAPRRASVGANAGAEGGGNVDPWRQAAARRRSSQPVVYEEDKPIPQPSPAALAARAKKVAAKTTAAAPGLAAAVAAEEAARPPLPDAYRRGSQDLVSEANRRERRRRSSDESAGSPGRQWLLKDMPSPAALAADMLPAMAAQRRRQSNESHASSRQWNVPTGRTMRPRHTRGMHRSLFEAPIPVGAPVPWQ